MELITVKDSEKPEVWEMLQQYLAELSNLGGEQATDGQYAYRYFDSYWTEPNRWPFWIIASEGKRAGFALVRKIDDDVFEMAEFYVCPECRRGGLGAKAARELFVRFPGKWRISEFRRNTPAIAFWAAAIADFEYKETVSGDHIVQQFDAGRRRPTK